jgi:hypothetical protein
MSSLDMRPTVPNMASRNFRYRAICKEDPTVGENVLTVVVHKTKQEAKGKNDINTLCVGVM